MKAATSTRKTAEVRREEIIAVALEEFGEHGLDGTSTDTIARKAGISQAYLFRLFGTKKELYLETVRRCLSQTLELFEEAAVGKGGEDALTAIGQAYRGLLADRTRLRAQMQAYADCDDDDVREVVREGYGRLVDYVERVSGAEPERIRDFFAFGMLLNVFASMDLLDHPAPWAKQLLEACLGPAPHQEGAR